MDIVEWNDRLCTGLAAIDRQHQALVRMINELYRQMRAGGSPVANETFAGLYNYILNHFQTEERLMDSQAYPDRVAHEAEHAVFIKTIDALHAQAATEGAASTEGLVVFLVDWFVDHISSTDQKLGAFVRERETAAP